MTVRVGRLEVVESRVPLFARVAFVSEGEVATASGHHEGLGPGVELLVLDDGEDAGDGEVVVFPQDGVFGIFGEFPGGGFGGGEEPRQGVHGVALAGLEGAENVSLHLAGDARQSTQGAEDGAAL